MKPKSWDTETQNVLKPGGYVAPVHDTYTTPVLGLQIHFVQFQRVVTFGPSMFFGPWGSHPQLSHTECLLSSKYGTTQYFTECLGTLMITVKGKG